MRRYSLTTSLLLLAIVSALLVGWPDLAAATGVAAQEWPTATPTPPANQRPDACEPNDTLERPCVLALDAVGGPFTFLPEGDRDYYSVDLGPQPGLALSVAVRGTPGLDLLTTIIRAGDNAALATISSPAISATLSADLAGWLIIRVENRAAAIASGQSYRIELRRTLPPPSLPAGAPIETLPPDRLENNWNPDTAAPIGVGYVYDLNFVCPVAWGCGGGDHDYMRVPVKAGVAYLIATFDLGPGVDTAIDLFWNDQTQPLATNDDARPGTSFLSALRWVAPADGEAIIRVGPRTGGLSPMVFDEQAGSYRFAIALAESDLGRQIAQRIAAQTSLPTTVLADGAAGGTQADTTAPAAPMAPPTPVPTQPIVTDGATGQAIVTAESTVLRTGPDKAAEAIGTLPQETIVTLLGQTSGAWARVQVPDLIVPGWVFASDMRRLPSTPTPSSGASAPETTDRTPPPGTPLPPGDAVAQQSPASSPISTPRVTRLDPAPPPVVAPPQRVPLTVSVDLVVAAPAAPTGGATPPARPPIAGMRVQLTNTLGDVLAEAITPANGQVTLTRDLAPGTALHVRVPAAGLEVPIDPAKPQVTIAIPAGGAA